MEKDRNQGWKLKKKKRNENQIPEADHAVCICV